MNAANVETTIREFIAGDEVAFRRLNEEWIVRHFGMERTDEELLRDPVRIILEPGGRIFFAVQQDVPVGCCALLSTGPGQYEVAKMAVTESCQGAGIGRRLLESVIAEARAGGAARLYLETNQKLGAAVRLYESLGFRHIPAERVVPSRYARANVYMELLLR
jgi:putative acetyltransferase